MTSPDDVFAVLGRSVELSLVLKATLILVAGLVGSSIARRARASRRHLMLASMFGGVLALPLVVFLGPSLPVRMPVASVVDTVATRIATVGNRLTPAPATPATARASTARPIDVAGRLPSIVRTAWALGAALLAAWLSLALFRLARIRRTGVPWRAGHDLVRDLAARAGLRRPIDVVLHEQVPAPLTCGVLQPMIALPSDAPEWSDLDLRRALIHEIEHVRRGDWAMQLLAHAACAAYWFHPLAWRALRRLRLEAERACDDAVVRDAAREDYADQLVSLAQRLKSESAVPVLAMAARSDLTVRVRALLDTNQRRGRAGVPAIVGAIGAAALIVLSIAPEGIARAAGNRVDRVATAGEGNDRRGRRALDEALYEAAESGDVAGIASLLDAGANVNAALDGDGTPLIGAARAGRLEAVRLLLERGADVSQALSGDGNALIMAAREGHVEILELLLDRGAQIDEIVLGDENALIQASGEGRLPVVQLLVARGANVNARALAERSGPNGGDEWRTPLSQAIEGGHTAVVSFLRASGAQE